jgi:hypothetical protein
MSETSSKKRKLSLPLVLAGGVSSLVLALGMSPTFSAFTAQITNNGNTAGMGTLIMEESDGTNTCLSTDGTNGLAGNVATCTSINKYGGNTKMVPGTPVATSISIKNTGNVAATAFSMAFSTCEPTGSSSLCSKMLVEVKSGSTILTPDNSTAASLAGTTIDIRTMLGLQPIGSAAIPLTITVTLPSATAPANDNAYQGLQISQPITWTFQS